MKGKWAGVLSKGRGKKTVTFSPGESYFRYSLRSRDGIYSLRVNFGNRVNGNTFRGFESLSLRHQDTHERSVKTLPCVSFSLSFIRFKGFLCPFFFLVQYGCRFFITCYLTQELPNHRTISNFYNLCTKSSVRARRHIAALQSWLVFLEKASIFKGFCDYQDCNPHPEFAILNLFFYL